MARSIANKKPLRNRHRVALIIETSRGPGRAILQGVARYIREGAAWSVYHEPRSLESALPSWFGKWEGDGIIVRAQDSRLAEGVIQTGLPVVDVLGVAGNRGLPLVHVDNHQIARLAADHFLERRLHQFAFCGVEKVNWSEERGAAFGQAVTEKNGTCEHFLLPGPETNATWEEEQDRLGEWLLSLPKPVGVMACNDPVGQRVLEAARRVRALVPEEIAVIGVDNDELLCEIADPPLSSVAAGYEWVGYHAAELLANMMSGAAAPKEPIFAPAIGCATRRSSEVLAVEDRDVVQTVAFIREHACEGISVQDVVDHVSISRSALKRRFSKQLSRGIHDEIIRVRMERARQLLSETDLSVNRIAVAIGYDHIEYFSVAFRREIGESPVEFRRRVGAVQNPHNA